jgi:hypothetical protein
MNSNQLQEEINKIRDIGIIVLGEMDLDLCFSVDIFYLSMGDIAFCYLHI